MGRNGTISRSNRFEPLRARTVTSSSGILPFNVVLTDERRGRVHLCANHGNKQLVATAPTGAGRCLFTQASEVRRRLERL